MLTTGGADERWATLTSADGLWIPLSKRFIEFSIRQTLTKSSTDLCAIRWPDGTPNISLVIPVLIESCVCLNDDCVWLSPQLEWCPVWSSRGRVGSGAMNMCQGSSEATADHSSPEWDINDNHIPKVRLSLIRGLTSQEFHAFLPNVKTLSNVWSLVNRDLYLSIAYCHCISA